VVLVEQARFGDGASGRNGGQMGTGQRAWPEEQEEELGFERAKALFDVAEEAKNHLRSTSPPSTISTSTTGRASSR
jgi:gamma-glutamylputrescine oxidase